MPTKLLRSLIATLVFASGCAAAAGVVVGKSEIAFTTRQMGVNFDGRFKQWKADIAFEPGALDKSRAEVDVDLASVDLASAETESEARGPLWFNTPKFPVAHFASTSIRSLGGDRYEIAGKLSVKGITRDCTVPITVKADAAGNRIAEGAFSLKRLDYKIGEGEWADTSVVDNDIRVRVKMVLAPPG
ncbi:MAG TPA: YceI family protein [Casimicrobiaceae bacterium]|nr:YceI family protein [Casimicrobiaceae bacterium]